MSWSLQVEGIIDTREEDWQDKIYEAEASAALAGAEVDQKFAVDFARDVIYDVISEGIVGSEGADQFRVSANGHTNPKHVAEGNWAEDFISISVYKVKE